MCISVLPLFSHREKPHNSCLFKLDSYTNAKHFFIALSHAHFHFKVMNIYPIDQYENTIPRVMPLHELKKALIMTQDSIGHLKMLCMRVLLFRGGMESDGNTAAYCPVLKNA